MISTSERSLRMSFVPTGTSRSSGPPDGDRNRLRSCGSVIGLLRPCVLYRWLPDWEQVVPRVRLHELEPAMEPRPLIHFRLPGRPADEARVALDRLGHPEPLDERIVEGLRHRALA